MRVFVRGKNIKDEVSALSFFNEWTLIIKSPRVSCLTEQQKDEILVLSFTFSFFAVC